MLESIVPEGLWVRGEIRNIKFHTSGHLYFALTDDKASIDGVIWRSNAEKLGFKPEDGMAVEAFGIPTLYEKVGRFQFSVKKLFPVGEGARAIAFRQLKEKLDAEGLFDSEHKKPLPLFPFRIGVITSATGAAIRDIIHVLSRRAPYVTVVLRPSRVQGDGAAEDIIEGIKKMNDYGQVDLLIVGRGGGSEEDLWCFNDERLAREIFASRLPIITAVGHEVDFTIADFVADKRAPTPSAAAEVAVRDISELCATILGLYETTKSRLSLQVERAGKELKMLLTRPAWVEPIRRIRDTEQRLDDITAHMDDSILLILERGASKLINITGRLSGMSIARTLQRGFAVVRRDDKLIRRAVELDAGDRIEIQFTDGKKPAKVIE